MTLSALGRTSALLHAAKKEPDQDRRCSGTCSGGNPCWHGAGHGGSHQCPTCPHDS